MPVSKCNKEKMRLNRFLARAGLGSRREVESLILSGKISVNGETCMELGTIVIPAVDRISMDGQEVKLPELSYYKYYKPRGVTTTLSDPFSKISLGDFLKKHDLPKGIVPIGRLDKDSEGLLILTNDGELVHKLMHPSFGITKVYMVLIDRRPEQKHIEQFLAGIECDNFLARAHKVMRMGPQIKDSEYPSGYWLEFTMIEGKKREIREMMLRAGYKVLRLIRVAHGPIKIGTLNVGEIRNLTPIEVKMLLKLKGK